MFFPELDPKSKVWIYAGNRDLHPTESNYVTDALNSFIPQWAAHGASLYGNGVVHCNRFIILAVDESKVSASGCSIDTSVHFVKKMGQELDIDFLTRTNIVVEKDGVLSTVHLSELSDYMDADLFNPMVTSLSELNEKWKIPVSESPFV
jgi:hypothetical protein